MMPAPADEDRGRRPLAWGYVAPPSYYEHGATQWKEQLTELASALGFVIDRWFQDSAGYTESLFTMWNQLRSFKVGALFISHPAPLQNLQSLQGMSFEQIKSSVSFEIYVLSESFAPIQPPPAEANLIRTPPSGRRFRHWRVPVQKKRLPTQDQGM